MTKSNGEGKSIDVVEIFRIALKRKWLIIAPLILVTAVAYGTSFVLDPIYESSTIVWIDKPHNVSRELINIIGSEGSPRMSNDDRRRQLQALQNELTSQLYLFNLIRDLNLDKDFELTRQAAKMREDNPDQSLEELKFHLLLEKLRSQIQVSFVGADQIRIVVESKDPVKSRDMVTRLAEILEQEKSRYELEKILDNQSFADLQLQRTQLEYQVALDSLTSAQSALAKLQLPGSISSRENLREIQSDIDKTQLEIADFRNELSGIATNLAGFDLSDARLKYTDTLVELRADIDSQIATFAAMMEKYAWDQRNVINVNIRLNDNIHLLEQTLAAAVDAQFASYPTNQRQLLQRYFVVKENLDILNSKVSELGQSQNKMDERINLVPKLQTQIAELERRVSDARRYRDAFRSEESTVEILSERAKDRTKYQVIEPARLPLAPSWPDKKKIIIMGFLLGLVIGGGSVFLIEIMDKSFKRVDDVEEFLGLPVLATIPKIDKLPRNR